jgi:glycosyltransferase involved in cell wall biosynthesis
VSTVKVPQDATGSRPYHIAAFPPGVAKKENPYFISFHRALAGRGISATDDLEIDCGWLAKHAGLIDGVHLHWPENFWRLDDSHGPGRMRRRLKVVGSLVHLRRFLRAARRKGVLRIWTVHNVEPHEGASHWDRYGYRLLAREADLLVCHSWSAAESIRRQYPVRGRIVVMPMGELGSVYPAARPRDHVLGELGLDPSLPTVSCLGRLRHYKGLDLACSAIERLNGRVQLIIGGARHGGFDVTPILQAARRTSAIAFLERMLSDQEFADLAAASDAQLLPYRKITGSAALLSALGFARGVIVSDLPYFREVLSDDPGAGVVVRSRDAEDWAGAIDTYLSRPVEERERAARNVAVRYSWDRCVEPLVAALQDWQRPETGQQRFV